MQNFSFNTLKKSEKNRRKSLWSLSSLNTSEQQQQQNENCQTSSHAKMPTNQNKCDLMDELQAKNKVNYFLMPMSNSSTNENINQANYFYQHQHQLKDKSSQENWENFLRNHNLPTINLKSINATHPAKRTNEPLDKKFFLNRTKSYGLFSSTPLKPVNESISSLTDFSISTQSKQKSQQHQQQSLLSDKSFNIYQSYKTNRASSSLNLDLGSKFHKVGNSLGSISSYEVAQHSSLSSVFSSSSNLKLSNGNLEQKLVTSGNIFQRREDWSILSKLPINKQNTMHIRLEDEGPYGNDEIRCFVLSHLSSLNIPELDCVFCDFKLVVYDRFPLIDGTLFVSPYCYNKDKKIPANVSDKDQYMYGICLKCLIGSESSHEIKCKYCKKIWQTEGKCLQIGTLYKYDVIAASPCCQMRLNCKKCNQPLVDYCLKSGGLPYFSKYSEAIKCSHCSISDFHFIKDLKLIYS